MKLKIYDVPNLVMAIVGAAILVIYPLFLWNGNGAGYIIMIIALYGVIRGLRLAFSQKAYEENQYKRMLMKRSYQKVYGDKAKIVPFIPLAGLILSLLSALIFPDRRGILAFFLTVTVLSAGVISFRYRRVMTVEKAVEDKKRMDAMVEKASRHQ